VTREKLVKWDYELAVKRITKKVIKEYENKIAELKELGVNFEDMERRVLLMTVDRNWIDHIDTMDQLRKGISLRAYGQVDPVISYKKEGFDMFDEMVERIQRTTISVLLKVKVELRPAPVPTQAPAQNQAQNQGQPAAPARAFRRQMPTPLSQMSSHKNTAENNGQNANEQEKK
jgi:preprotein translocase subunit SecA